MLRQSFYNIPSEATPVVINIRHKIELEFSIIQTSLLTQEASANVESTIPSG
jgi:hypothetical protein